MAFTGTPVVQVITDGLVRIRGLELPGVQATPPRPPSLLAPFIPPPSPSGTALGTIALHEFLGTPDVRLPLAFKPRHYIYSDDGEVTLQDSVQVYIDQVLPGHTAVPIGIAKIGTTPTDFEIIVTNGSFGAQVILGTAFSFGALGGTSVASTGATAITGDLGVSPGATITGFPPGTVTGATHAGDAAAAVAQSDALLAFTALNAATPTANLSGTPLDGLTLPQGVYKFDTTAALGAAILTLDGQNDPNAIFVIQVGTDLTIAGGATVALINGAVPQNVFWVVGGNVTIGAGSTFVGELLAHGNIALGAATSVSGGLFSLTGSITLNDNAVTVPTIGPSFVPVGTGPLEIYVKFH